MFLGRREVRHHGRRMECGGVQQLTSGECEADGVEGKEREGKGGSMRERGG